MSSYKILFDLVRHLFVFYDEMFRIIVSNSWIKSRIGDCEWIIFMSNEILFSIVFQKEITWTDCLKIENISQEKEGIFGL